MKGIRVLELKKKTKKRQLNLDKNKRMNFVSDIHGDYNTLKLGLEDLNFNSDDYQY